MTPEVIERSVKAGLLLNQLMREGAMIPRGLADVLMRDVYRGSGIERWPWDLRKLTGMPVAILPSTWKRYREAKKSLNRSR